MTTMTTTNDNKRNEQIEAAVEYTRTFAAPTGRYTKDAAYRALRVSGMDSYNALIYTRNVWHRLNTVVPCYAVRKAMRDATLAVGREN